MMVALPENPFRPTKFEHDQDPVFWLSARARRLPSSLKHAFVSGSRGSGKTTLLRSLRTMDIKTNESLRSQYRTSTFDWFGVYIQFNRTLQSVNAQSANAVLKHIGNLDSSEEDDNAISLRVFQAYLELTILLAFTTDIVEGADRKRLHLVATSERRICESILRRLREEVSNADIYSLKDVLEQRRTCFSAIPTHTSVAGVLDFVNSFQPGDLLDVLCDLVGALRGELIRKRTITKPIVLIDDCESLTRPQQAMLNTTLKQFEGRVKFVISFIEGQYDRNSSALPNTVLTNSDFEPIRLDDERREEFQNFCERVTTLRFQHYLDGTSERSRQPLPPFSLERTLGRFSPNQLIDRIAEGSLSPAVKHWRGEVSRTKTILREVITKRNWPKFSLEDGQTPYVEHVLIDLLGIDSYTFGSVPRQDALAKTFDRKQFAALIYAVREIIGSRVIPYAGRDVVLSLATGCIRDYLDIMAEIYEEAIRLWDSDWSTFRDPKSWHLTAFNSPKQVIPIDTQRMGIYRASREKLDVLHRFTIRSSFDVVQVVSGLAALLIRLQRPAEAYKYVSQAERGVFVIDPRALDKIFAVKRSKVRTRDVLATLQRDGFIKLLTRLEDMESRRGKSARVEFHLHRRLFPELGVSYRGPYETVRLDERRLAELVLEPDVDPGEWARLSIPSSGEEAGQGEFGL